MAKFEKGSPEWAFFAEFYLLCQKYYGMSREELEQNYDEFCRDTDALHKKYANVSPELNRFARFMIIGLIDWFNAEYSEKGGLDGK